MFWNGSGWWMIMGGLWMIIFWGVIIFLIVWAVRKFSGRDNTHIERRGPLDIAKERYAKGEISKEQYEQIKRDISG